MQKNRTERPGRIPALILGIFSFKTALHHFLRLDGIRWRATDPRAWRYYINVLRIVVAVGLGCCGSQLQTVAARDAEGLYANSPLKSWFESLHSSKGPCCSGADGTALSDIDWKSENGHYIVRVEGKWWSVPDEAIVNESNRAKRAMVWPVYYRELETLVRVDIRCFIPGGMA